MEAPTHSICDAKEVKSYELNDCEAQYLASHMLDDIKEAAQDIEDFKGEMNLFFTPRHRKSELRALIGAAERRMDRHKALFKKLGGRLCESSR